MIYSIEGLITGTGENFLVLDVGGVGYKIYTNRRTLAKFKAGDSAKFFTHLHTREDGMDLYGFHDAKELSFFELLISVSGVGPRSALAILGVSELKDLAAAIKEGRPDVLTRASGIGRKTAERIIVELRNKVDAEKSEATVKRMETDADLIETLVGLGYARDQARAALGKIDGKLAGIEERLKEALKMLSGRAK